MKVLFFIDTLSQGGKERRLSQLVKGLKLNSGIEFSIAIMSRDIFYKEVTDLNIEIHYIIRKTKKDISVFLKFFKLCQSYRPDIVHCWDSMTAIYSVPSCKILKIKLINGMVIDTPVKRNIFNKNWLRARLTFPFSDVIVGNSIAGLKAYHASDYKSICIYNGIDLSRLEKLIDYLSMRHEILKDNSSDLFIVGMVAAFEERKDYDTLIKAATTLISERKNVRFILVGDGTDFNRVKWNVPVELLNKIVFLGKRSDIESIINIFDIGVLLTNAKVHGEGVSNSIIEYMALGKPVLATRGGGTDEVVIDNRNGFLIDPQNATQLREKICILIENKRLIEELGREGLRMIKEKFDLKIMTNKYICLYNKLNKN